MSNEIALVEEAPFRLFYQMMLNILESYGGNISLNFEIQADFDGLLRQIKFVELMRAFLEDLLRRGTQVITDCSRHLPWTETIIIDVYDRRYSIYIDGPANR